MTSRPVGRPITKPCGTVPAYKRHLRLKKKDPSHEACDPCKAAWAKWHREYTNAKKGVHSNAD